MRMKPNYIYNLDDHPPIRYALLYGFQWAMIMFPGLIIAASLSVGSFPAGALDKVYFLQMTLLTSGLFTWLQTLWGHRYPLLEGPSTALMLAFILLAPLGLATIQGGMILGAVLLILTVLSRQLDRVTVFFTPNVIGVILMLVSLGLIRPLIGFMTGGSTTDGGVFLISVFLVLLIASLSHWLQGFWKTVSILLGMILGSLLFYFLGRLSFDRAYRFSLAFPLSSETPHFSRLSLAGRHRLCLCLPCGHGEQPGKPSGDCCHYRSTKTPDLDSPGAALQWTGRYLLRDFRSRGNGQFQHEPWRGPGSSSGQPVCRGLLRPFPVRCRLFPKACRLAFPCARPGGGSRAVRRPWRTGRDRHRDSGFSSSLISGITLLSGCPFSSERWWLFFLRRSLMPCPDLFRSLWATA